MATVTRGFRALIVEDEEILAEMIQESLLEDFDVEFDVVEDCMAAAGRLASASYEVIIIDYRVFDPDCYDLSRKSGLLTPEIETIILIEEPDDEVVAGLFRLGASSYVVEDDDMGTRLVETVRQALEHRDGRYVAPPGQEHAERLREVYNNAPVGITVTNAKGRIEYANPVAAAMLGIRNAYDLESTDASFFYSNPGDRALVYERLREYGYVSGMEGEARRIDGTCLWVSLSAVMTKDEEGKVSRVLIFIMDITNRKEAELELVRINDELNAYAHTVSHDLKGPLAAMGALIDLAIEASENAEFETVTESLDALRNNVSSMQEHVMGMLQLAESGQLPDEVEELNIRRLVDGIVGLLSPQVHEKGVAFEIDEDLGRIYANKPQIQQIFYNLISNAIKHNDNDAPVVRIARIDRENRRFYRYVVHDNGSGVDRTELAYVFTPFHVGRDGRQGGMGLSIARKLARIYNGDITVTNEDGARFELSLADYRHANLRRPAGREEN